MEPVDPAVRADTTKPARRRHGLLSTVLLLLGIPGFIFCSFNHVCMCGHGAHPIPGREVLVDILWAGLFFVSAIAMGLSSTRWRYVLTPLVLLVLLSRSLGSGGGALLIPEGLVLAILLGASVAMIFAKPGEGDSGG